MSKIVLKYKYLKTIQKALEPFEVFFNLSELDVNEFTEESLFMEYWDLQQINENGPNNQLYKMWCFRLQQMQENQNEPFINEEIVCHDISFDGVHLD